MCCLLALGVWILSGNVGGPVDAGVYEWGCVRLCVNIWMNLDCLSVCLGLLYMGEVAVERGITLLLIHILSTPPSIRDSVGRVRRLKRLI